MKQTGFTLVEVLVALFVFAVLGVLVASGLHFILRSHRLVVSRQATLYQLMRTEMMLRRDLLQLALSSGAHDAQPVSMVQSRPDGLEFTRTGVFNPYDAFPRDNFARVSYLLKDHHLLRVVSSNRQILLKRVLSFRVDFLDAQNHYHAQWPLEGATVSEIPMNILSLPRAIRVTVNVQNQGEWYWVFPILGK